MIVPHVLVHQLFLLNPNILELFISVLLYVAVFGLIFAILQRKRDLLSAMISHGLVDVIRFMIFGLPAAAYAMYRTAIAYFATRKTPSTFISLMNGQPVDPENGNMITLVPELYNVGVVGKAVVYLECSYNPQIANFYSNGPVGLTPDITEIKF